MAKTKQLVNIFLLGIIILVISIESVNSMRANVWYFKAVNTLKQSKALMTPAELKFADDAINLALKLEPTQAHYWQLSAYVKMLGLTLKDMTSEDSLLAYKAIEQALLTSLQNRRAWSETWMELAKVVGSQEGLSQRVLRYIDQAKKTGPYKFEVRSGIIQIALINWPQLPPNFKAQYMNELNLAAQYDEKLEQTFDIANQINKVTLLCMSLQFGSELKSVRKSSTFEMYCK